MGEKIKKLTNLDFILSHILDKEVAKLYTMVSHPIHDILDDEIYEDLINSVYNPVARQVIRRLKKDLNEEK